jgi:hypothetical protein
MRGGGSEMNNEWLTQGYRDVHERIRELEILV